MYNVRVYQVITEGHISLTPHFKVREFRCSDGCPIVFIHPNLPNVLEDLRKQMGCSLIINSGYRTYSHNATVGGARNSMHLYGLAADVRPSNGDVNKLYEIASKYLNGRHGLGKYPTFVHIDLRDKPSRW